MKPFFGWFNSFGNFIQLLKTKGSYCEILILRSITELSN